MPENLEGPAGRRTPALTDELVRLVDFRTLWTNYGINGNVIVSARLVHLSCFECYSSADSMSAFYVGLPTCRHLPDDFPGSITSSDQRDVQGSPRCLDMRICEQWASRGYNTG